MATNPRDAAASGSTVAYHQTQGLVFAVPPVPLSQPRDQYTPNDFMTLTVVVAVMCGLFSPLSLMFTLPAYLFSRKLQDKGDLVTRILFSRGDGSREAAKVGDIKQARWQGLIAAYLNVTAVIFALVFAAVAMGAVLGIYGPTYYLDQCRDRNTVSSSSFRRC